MTNKEIAEIIENGQASLGIELGSTRIKAVLIAPDTTVLASGDHTWENKLIDGIWTYSLEDVWAGLRDAYSSLAKDAAEKYGVKIVKLRALGFSAMMHGYLPFNKDGELLTPFRTWRNTKQEKAADELTSLFGFNIPQRWSIAHLYQAILNSEEHTKDIAFLTTLAGYVHWCLTGEKTLGIGEASGMFPIDSKTLSYNSEMLDKFSEIPSVKAMPWNIRDILPKVLLAGDSSARLTDEGAKMLDITGTLQGGSVVCPPEGDAGTGMVATNAVLPGTGNISAGTSVFSMVVLKKELNGVYSKIDMVTTPSGAPVAMVHCNNCSSEIDAWVKIFNEFAKSFGVEIKKPDIYDKLYEIALTGDSDCGGVIAYNYFSGEPVTDVPEGRPMLVRTPDSNFNLANFMRAQIFSAMAALKYGNDILSEKENVQIDCLTGHGGLFKTPKVGQKLMAAAMKAPIAVMKTAAEGGAWGIAVLAEFAGGEHGGSLPEYLSAEVFKDAEISVVKPSESDILGFNGFMKNYIAGLDAQRKAAEKIK